MWYCYILRSSKNGRLYVGFTSNLKQRVEDHNAKRGGIYTSRSGPYELFYYEAYADEKDARAAERFYKTGSGREILRKKLYYAMK
jgi:putative endonuclease